MNSMESRNQTFNYLYALAIIMVIDDHVSRRINIFNNIFPYNSFYMPLFVFASGYFFKQKPFFSSINHKIHKLLLPYVLWNIGFNIIAFAFDFFIGTKWYASLNAKNIMKMFLPGYTLSSLNGPAWFLYMLFLISIIYICIKGIINSNLKNDIILLIVLLVVGVVSVTMAVNGLTKIGGAEGAVYILVTKIGFYLQFYHMGYMFKVYFEKILQKKRKMIVCFICIGINIILILIYGEKINFYGTNNMASFNNCYLPLITSITGIVFYYEIMSFLSEKIGSIRMVEFIAKNTFIIMQTHLCFLNIPNIYAYYMKLKGNIYYSDFDINAFLASAGVRYNDNTKLVAFFCGLIGSMLIAFLFGKIKNIMNEKRRNGEVGFEKR